MRSNLLGTTVILQRFQLVIWLGFGGVRGAVGCEKKLPYKGFFVYHRLKEICCLISQKTYGKSFKLLLSHLFTSTQCYSLPSIFSDQKNKAKLQTTSSYSEQSVTSSPHITIGFFSLLEQLNQPLWEEFHIELFVKFCFHVSSSLCTNWKHLLTKVLVHSILQFTIMPLLSMPEVMLSLNN